MGSTAIAYHPADEATARSIATQLERRGEGVTLIRLSDQVEKLGPSDRSIILWSRDAQNSTRFDDMWQLLGQRQHVVIGDISSNELPERVPEEELLVVSDDETLAPKEPTDAIDLDALDQRRRQESLKLSVWPMHACLASLFLTPIIAVSLPLVGYEHQVSFGQIITESAVGAIISNLLIFPWFAILSGVSRWDIQRNWPNHKLATIRMLGAAVGLCIPLILQVLLIAITSTENHGGNTGVGFAIGLLIWLHLLVTPIFGLVGMLIGWTIGHFIKTKPPR